MCTRSPGGRSDTRTLPAGGLQAKTFSAAGAGVPTALVHGGVLACANAAAPPVR